MLVYKKKVYFSLLFLLGTFFCYAQKNEKFVPYSELGLTLGTSYYNGELNPTIQFPVTLLKPAFGLSYRRNTSKRYAVALTAVYSNLKADETYANHTFSTVRSASFKSVLVDVAGKVEFNFFQYEVGHKRHFSTPFVFVGIAGYYINPKVSVYGISSTESFSVSPVQLAFPLGIGYKASIARRLSLTVECGWRKTYTDYIDGISKVYSVADTINTAFSIAGKQRGNSKNNDWYTFAGVTIAYTIYDKGSLCPAYDKKRPVRRWIEDKVY